MIPPEGSVHQGAQSTLAQRPFLGVGLGFRAELEGQIWANRHSVDWLEVISEHFLDRPPERIDQALQLREAFPLIPHGVELSIGTPGDLDPTYVESLAGFVELIDAPWFSDHLCFTRAGGIALGQLIPLLRTRTAAAEIGRKAQQVQERVGRPFLLENITYYFDFDTELSETQFLVEVMEHCDCGLLLDLTNVYINSVNHRFDPLDFLQAIPLERVVQVHLAGGEPTSVALIDSHSGPVHPEVFDLLRETVGRAPNLRGVMIERDQQYPDDFGELARDLDNARDVVCAAR